MNALVRLSYEPAHALPFFFTVYTIPPLTLPYRRGVRHGGGRDVQLALRGHDGRDARLRLGAPALRHWSPHRAVVGAAAILSIDQRAMVSFSQAECVDVDLIR